MESVRLDGAGAASARLSHQQAPAQAPGDLILPVLSDDLARSLREDGHSGRGPHPTPSHPPTQRSIDTIKVSASPRSSDTDLDKSLGAKLKEIQRCKASPIADEAAAEKFLRLVSAYEHATRSEQEKILREAREALWTALGLDPAEVRSAGVLAGRLGPLHLLPADMLQLIPSFLDLVLGSRWPIPSAMLRVVSQLGLQLYNPHLSAGLWQRMLYTQQLVRKCVSKRYAEVADVDKDIEAMRSQIEKWEAMTERGPALDPVALDERIGGLKSAVDDYKDSRRQNGQRYRINAREGSVRILKALINTAGLWTAFEQARHPQSRWQHAPEFFYFQLAGTLVSWPLLVLWACPKREELVRNAGLDIDIRKFAPGIAHGLAERRKGQPGLDETAARQIADLAKTRRMDQLDKATKVFTSDQLRLVAELAAALDMPAADVSLWVRLRDNAHKSVDDATRLALDAAVERRTRAWAPDKQQWFVAKAAELHAATQDLDNLTRENWTAISTGRKRLLDSFVAELPAIGAARLFMHYMFTNAANSPIPQVRIPAVLQKALQHQFFEHAAYAQYKYGKSLQFMGLGGLAAFALAAAILSLLKAFERPLTSEWGMHALSWGLLALYSIGEAMTAVLFNQVLLDLGQMRVVYPFGNPTTPQKFGQSIRQAVRNMSSVAIEGKRQVAGRYVHMRANAALERALKAKTRLQATPASPNDIV